MIWKIDTVKKARAFLKKGAVSKARERIEKYIELGKTAFDPHSKEAKVVNYVLSRFKTLWNAPSDKQEAKKHLVIRTTEARADLFAMDMLFKHHGIDALLYQIAFFPWGSYERNLLVNNNHEWDLSRYVVREGTDDYHPSDFERLLYTVGFLVSKGIDVSKALEEWRNNGICRDIDAYVASL